MPGVVMPGVIDAGRGDAGRRTIGVVMLKRYLDYNLWANRRLVENIRAVPADLVETVPLAPFGSIHDAFGTPCGGAEHLAGENYEVRVRRILWG